MLSFCPRGVLDEILNLIESVFGDFPSYSFSNNIFVPVCFRLAGNWKIHVSAWRRCSKILRIYSDYMSKSRKENPQKLTQLSSRSHPRHLVGKRTAQKDITIDTTSDSQVNSNFPNKWSPASLTFNNYFYLFLYLYIT